MTHTNIDYFGKCETTWTEAEYHHAHKLAMDLNEDGMTFARLGMVHEADNCWRMSNTLQNATWRYTEYHIDISTSVFLETL